MTQTHHGTALITGASSSIGAVCAGRVAGRELVTIPSLHAVEKWGDREAARGEIFTPLSSNIPASRYTAAH